MKTRIFPLFFLMAFVGCNMLGASSMTGNFFAPSLALTEHVAPGGIVLLDPKSSPSFIAIPTVRVTGVWNGDTVKLFTDSTCTTLVASGVATGSIIDLTTSVLAAGTYNFYANSINASSTISACSTATIPYQKMNCPNGYIPIVANLDVGTTAEFCVMKYEAKCVGASCPSSTAGPTAIATSQASGAPWVNISANDALLACQTLGAGYYDLISNAEWMTIARDIEGNSSNWVGGVLNRGWSASGIDDGYANAAVAASTDANCLCNTAADTCAATGVHQLKRTHILTNNEEIWDLAGNVSEWTDWIVQTPNTASFTLGPVGCSASWEGVQAKITSCSGQTPDLGDPFPGTSSLASPFDTSLSSAENIGQIWGGANGAAARGGYFAGGVSAGIFSLNLSYLATISSSGIGFR